MKVCVVGLWHQGVVGAACLADLGFDVVATDIDVARLETLAQGRSPLFEPGLDELLSSGLACGKLRFTVDMAEAVAGRELILWMFDTPVNDQDESDLSGVLAAARSVGPHVMKGAILLSSTQAPVGTTERIVAAMREANSALDCTAAYTPENLKLGEAIARFRNPPLPVLGTDDAGTLARLKTVLAPISTAWQGTSLRTAEMLKHALNAYLAATVTFANELGNICDCVGADGKAVGVLLRLDPRIGPKAMLSPGLGFAGGTLARDVQTLRSLGDNFGLETLLLDGLWAANRAQNSLVIRQLRQRLPDLRGLPVAVLGLTYKAGTSTLRRSAAIEIANQLIQEGMLVSAYDPRVDPAELRSLSALRLAKDAYDAAAGSHALVLMTPWPEFADIDLRRLKQTMKNAFVIDTAGLWSYEDAMAAGISYWDIGRGRTGAKVPIETGR